MSRFVRLNHAVHSMYSASSGVLLLSCLFLMPAASYGQHTPHEIGVSIAINGQVPLIHTADQGGFYTNPFIGRVQYQAVTNGVQSLSVFLESISEQRSRDGLFNTDGGQPYDARIAETLHMTSLGLEMVRNLIVAGDLRIGGGVDIGFGLGRPFLDVTKKTDATVTHTESMSTWDGFFAAALIRARYSIVKTGKMDIGFVLAGRYWTFLTMGPLSDVSDIYNGPPFRSVHDLGYLVGISFGF